MIVQDIIAKRKRIWEHRQDINYDAEFVEAVADEIVNNEILRKAIKEKPYLLIEMCLTIVDKQGNTVPFFLNEVQQDFISQIESKGTDKPYFVLKGRQQGFTTLITAIQLCYAITTRNFSGMTIADSTENTRVIFQDKAKTVYNRLPNLLKPTEKYNSANELYFEKLNASWRVATATNNVGRSRTLRFLHMSEIAFYEVPFSQIQAGLGQAVAKDALVVYETTANGFNDAKLLWDSGSCNNLFYEWWRTAEYASANVDVLQNAQDAWSMSRVIWLQEKGLTDEQIAWYVEKYNSYIDKSLIKQEYPCTPDEAFVSSNESIFDTEKVVTRLTSVPKPIRQGEFVCRQKINSDGTIDVSQIEFVEKSNGIIKIYNEPEKDCVYALGGDTAGEGSDWFTGHIIDCRSGKQCAVLQAEHIDEDEYATQVYCLGQMYNWALVGLEVNFSTYPTRRLVDMQYPNLYLRQVYDSISDSYQAKYGFKTTSLTRPNILAELVKIVRENVECINDDTTLKEMLVFCKDKNGKAQALSGYHDDNVLGLAIAYEVRSQQELPRENKKVASDNELPFALQSDTKTKKKVWGDYN